MNEVHDAAQRGFEAEAGRYARGRPEYPDGLLDWLRDDLALAPGRTALDLGAGTGKFTSLLTRSGATVLAVEPVASMRAELARRLPGAQAFEGTAQHMPVPDGAIDVVICAQAFHWFASEAALAEIHRVLKPGGRLGLVWNVRDESVDWMAKVTAIITPHEGDAPRFYKGDWRRPFESADVGRQFSPLQCRVLRYEHVGAPEEVVLNRFLSVSFIAALDDARKAEVAASLRALIDSHPDLRGKQALAAPYRTEAYWCERRP
ncbi:MAG: methyltransferase domain-containing protein [Paucibacter sp.]|nr:methyltransferase domain-containing protein [Roseateles sp.]